MSSWKGIKVRNADGREGSIASDYQGFGHRVWLCEDFQGGPKWLPLGDHNSAAA